MNSSPLVAIVPMGIGLVAGAAVGGSLGYRVGYEAHRLISPDYRIEREKLGNTVGGILGTLGTVWGGIYGLGVGSALAATASVLTILKNKITTQ